eukprot:gene42239-56106_t
MSKEETTPGGLLSKVVRFVKNPTVNWTELDSIQDDRESQYSKQMLKEMIERKRRNDFVRKREFDMLRKMRRSEVMAGQDPAARPSFFQSSMPSKPDDRAMTLKKIDEIEAQMSMQWWKTTPTNLRDGVAISGSSDQARVAEPTQLQIPMLNNALPLLQEDYRPTEPMGLLPQSEKPAVIAKRAVVADVSVVKPPKRLVIAGLAGQNYDGGASGFGYSNMMAMDVSEIAHDAELEEASIRFANGDDIGAEAGLHEMLAPGGSRAGQSEAWMVLFDLYR